MISRTIATLLALLLLLMGTALAADYGYEIDVDAMKALEFMTTTNIVLLGLSLE